MKGIGNMRANTKKWFGWFFLCSLSASLLPAVDASGAGLSSQETVAKAPGTILSETQRDLGNGYLEVRRSQVNSPGHWEGIGHFGFVYFKEEKLCQCGPAEIKVSPNGELAVYVDEKSGALTLFRADSRSKQLLSERYIGHPVAADWQLADRRVVLTLENSINGQSTISKLTVSLN
jgi:hypothetical protein